MIQVKRVKDPEKFNNNSRTRIKRHVNSLNENRRVIRGDELSELLRLLRDSIGDQNEKSKT